MHSVNSPGDYHYFYILWLNSLLWYEVEKLVNTSYDNIVNLYIIRNLCIWRSVQWVLYNTSTDIQFIYTLFFRHGIQNKEPCVQAAIPTEFFNVITYSKTHFILSIHVNLFFSLSLSPFGKMEFPIDEIEFPLIDSFQSAI